MGHVSETQLDKYKVGINFLLIIYSIPSFSGSCLLGEETVPSFPANVSYFRLSSRCSEQAR